MEDRVTKRLSTRYGDRVSRIVLGVNGVQVRECRCRLTELILCLCLDQIHLGETEEG